MLRVTFFGCLVEDAGWCSLMLPRDSRAMRVDGGHEGGLPDVEYLTRGHCLLKKNNDCAAIDGREGALQWVESKQ